MIVARLHQHIPMKGNQMRYLFAFLFLLLGAQAATAGPSRSLADRETYSVGTVAAPGVNGVALLARAVGKVTVRDGAVDGAYRVFDMVPEASGNIAITNVKASNLVRSFARIRGTTTGTIRSVTASFRATPAVEPELPVGIGFYGDAHDWLVQNVWIGGAQMVMGPDRYWNGDCISSELGNARLTFVNVHVRDCTDGGFDLKGSDWRMENVSSAGSSRNYRFWSSGTAGTLTSESPIKRGGMTSTAHIYVHGDDAKAIKQRAFTLRIAAPTKSPIGRRADPAAGIASARAWREHNRAGFDAMAAAGCFATDDMAALL